MNRLLWIAICTALLSLSAFGQTADEIVSKYIKAIGGADKLAAVKSVRATGKFIGGGGFEAVIVNENKRPDKVRNEFSLQGMTSISAYDGKTGWKLNPFGGKKDAETMNDDEVKSILEAADIDGPLVNAAAKGNKIEYVGKEDYEGSDVYKLKVTMPNGTIKHFYLDAEYYIPIKVETRRIIRGNEVEFEQILGAYKQVDGVYFPFSTEYGAIGGSSHSIYNFDKIEVNPVIDDSRFAMPAAKSNSVKP
jgi:outer membrane lipoprotein-sorting protein